MEDIKHPSNRGCECLGEEGPLFVETPIVEAVDFAVVLARDVTAILGDEVLLDEIVVLGVGAPFRLLE